jgi:hypothetical protein
MFEKGQAKAVGQIANKIISQMRLTLKKRYVLIKQQWYGLIMNDSK